MLFIIYYNLKSENFLQPLLAYSMYFSVTLYELHEFPSHEFQFRPLLRYCEP